MTLPPYSDRAGQVTALRLVQELQQALRRGDRARLVACLGQLVSLRAAMGEQWHALAHLAARNGELSLARAAMDLFVEVSGGGPVAQYEKAALLEQTGRLRQAYELMRTLPEDSPDAAANAFSRGTAALFLGEIDEARHRLTMATRLRPQSGAAWLSLAMSIRAPEAPKVADSIIAAEPQMIAAEEPQRAAYCYARGKVHAERGEHDRAFAAFARGAAIMKSLDSYDRGADRRDAEESLRGYSADTIAELRQKWLGQNARSIFVTGLPRSGTTLVEQILTSHSAVTGGGEIGRLGLLANEVGGISGEAVRRYGDARPGQAAELWRHWLEELFPEPGRVVDKTLSNTRQLGIAASLLPEAPIIWVTRDPLDRAWSCFRTFFITSMPWSYDLEDIAFHFRLEDRLLEDWRQLLGDRLLVVPYEALVDDPQTWIRRILAHSRLDEEPQVFTPHTTRRAVTTASVMQVRRPINRAGIGSAEPYRRYLQPFIEAYYG